MEILFDHSPDGENSWLFLKEDDRLELGAQVLPSIEQPGELIVVWRAPVRVDGLRNIIEKTAKTLRERGDSFRARLTGYGRTKEFLHLGRFITREEKDGFEAFRAELETPEETVTVWANVVNGDGQDLAHASDNIGISVPARSLLDWSSPLLAYAIASTKDIRDDQAADWLRLIAHELFAPPPDGRLAA